MKYQLVIQFPENLDGGFDKLIQIEDELDEKLGADAEVDGHDIGSGQMNIFIITSNPPETFNKIKNILTPWKYVFSDMRAAYRNVESDNFICLYPEDLTEFKVT